MELGGSSRPDMAFWARLSKSTLIDLHLSPPAKAELSDAERTAFQKAQTKRTKDDVAKSVAQQWRALAGCRTC